MDKENGTIAGESAETAATQTGAGTDTDYEATITSLKERQAKLELERDNYKEGMLKYKAKAKEDLTPDEDSERIKLAAKEALAETQIVELARELDDINRKALKENKELRLALQNKTSQAPAAAIGGHTETPAVRDTTISPEQMRYFTEQLKWTEKDIANYKRNLARKI